jgi:hypothetical protein
MGSQGLETLTRFGRTNKDVSRDSIAVSLNAANTDVWFVKLPEEIR